jgi:anti-sigma B factor antagonist
VSVHALPIDTDCEQLPDGSFVLCVRGELDMATAPLVERALEDCGDDDARVLVDLSGVEFIDAAGLRILNEGEARLRRGGGELLLRRPSWNVRRVLKTVGRRAHLPIASE